MIVYFLQATDRTGPVKIGCSYAPERRLALYACWSPYPLEIVARFPGDQRVEGRFHQMFMHLHSHHEWFRPAPELSDVIARINAGTFTLSDLPDTKSDLRRATARRTWQRRFDAQASIAASSCNGQSAA